MGGGFGYKGGMWIRFTVVAVLAVAMPAWAWGQQASFEERLADAAVGEVQVEPGGTVGLPYITWGGDVATFHANGGVETTPESIYGRLGLDLELVAGDDFEGQVRRYLAGETPFLRGTFNMLALASGKLGADPRTKPVVFLQLTWSAGDHLVTRGGRRDDRRPQGQDDRAPGRRAARRDGLRRAADGRAVPR